VMAVTDSRSETRGGRPERDEGRIRELEKRGVLKIVERDGRKFFYATQELVDESILCPYHPHGTHNFEGCLLAFVINGIPLAFKRALADKADEIKRRDKATGVPAANKFRSDGVNDFLAGKLHDELRQVAALADWARRTPEENRAEICRNIKQNLLELKPPTSIATNSRQVALHEFVCHAAISIAATGLCRSTAERPTAMTHEACGSMVKDTSGGEANRDFFESFEWKTSTDGLYAPMAFPSIAELVHRYGSE
jgi:hypothetical protein